MAVAAKGVQCANLPGDVGKPIQVEQMIDYVMAKRALVDITIPVALELAQTGITCNVLQPRWVLTPHCGRLIADQMARTNSAIAASAIRARIHHSPPAEGVLPTNQLQFRWS